MKETLRINCVLFDLENVPGSDRGWNRLCNPIRDAQRPVLPLLGIVSGICQRMG